MSEETPQSLVLELQNPKIATPMRVELDRRVTVGRADTTGTIVPEVDLSPYGAEDSGISRQHLQLFAENGHPMVMDLRSGNGTQLNGMRLEPNKSYRLRDEDMLKLGSFELKVKIVARPAPPAPTAATSTVEIKREGGTMPLNAGKIFRGRGELIMIVEDDAAVAQLIALVLQRAGYTTHISRDVLSAMRFYTQKHPNAIVLDLMLPDMHGLELCRYVRRDPQNNDTPIIITSALKTAAMIAQSMQAGANQFLGKPFSAQELASVVTSFVHQSQSGEPSMNTKALVGTAPLQKLKPDTRKNTAVLFVAGYGDDPVTIKLAEPVSLGRAGNTAVKSHVDLSRFEAADLGVSRLHAKLHYNAGAFLVEDMGSANGTFINGEPVPPRQPTGVQNGDEVRLGRLRMYIYFLTDPEE